MIQPSSTLQIKTGARGSRLARCQVEEVSQLLKKAGLTVSLNYQAYETAGDRDKTTPLTAGVADDFFTDALDTALLKRDIDIAVHSAKDLPSELREGLAVFALTSSADETDAFVGKVPLKNLKPGQTIGTSSKLRADYIRKLYPKLKIVEIRGTIEERIALVDQGGCDGVVIASIALKRLGLEDKITDIFPWEGWPLQGQLAIVGRTEDARLKDIFKTIDVRRNYGSVQLVGAGPGDPDLITVKGMKALQKCDCVFYDYLAHPDLLDYAPQAEKINAGKRKGEHTMSQEELSRLLRKKAMEGKTVVRLKGGDPLIFGRGADEIEYLRQYHIPVYVIPGVTSATGIPSGIGIPLTARGVSSSVAFVTAHAHAETGESPQPVAIPDADTVIFFMGLTKLSLIIQALKDSGRALTMPVMIVSRGTYEDEQIVEGTLDDIEDKCAAVSLKPPALIIVSETIKFWQKPPDEEPILYTGTLPQKYGALGRLVHFPMIKIEPVELSEDERKKVSAAARYDMLIFTSRFAVEYFVKILKEGGINPDWKSNVIAAIGRETARALAQAGITTDISTVDENSEGLLEAILHTTDVSGKTILFPRSSLPNPFLKQQLEERGAKVDEVVIYRNIKPPKKQLPGVRIRRVIFTSPSTVKNFIDDYGQIPTDWKIFSRGPKTERTLKEMGYSPEQLVI